MKNDICGIDFKRRSATRDDFCIRFRGLKPTATGMGSLRDREAVGEGSCWNSSPRIGDMTQYANTILISG